jgi:hypothetical protein
MKENIVDILIDNCKDLERVIFSCSPFKI